MSHKKFNKENYYYYYLQVLFSSKMAYELLFISKLHNEVTCALPFYIKVTYCFIIFFNYQATNNNAVLKL